MKKQIHMIMIVLVLTLLTLPAMAQVKVGFINSEKIISAYKPAIDAQQKLIKLRDTITQELQSKQQEILNTQEQLKTQSMMLTQGARDQKEQELQAMVVQLQQYEMEKQQELVQKQNEWLKPVYDEITKAIGEIGEAQNYDFIFDIIQGNLLWGKDKHDMTDTLIGKLGKDKPGSVVSK